MFRTRIYSETPFQVKQKLQILLQRKERDLAIKIKDPEVTDSKAGKFPPENLVSYRTNMRLIE